MTQPALELLLYWFSTALIFLSGAVSIFYIIRQKNGLPSAWILVLAVLLLTLAITLRWLRVGHGPFVSMFEILSSNIWSFAVFYLVVYWRIPEIRHMAPFFIGIFYVMAVWMLMMPNSEYGLPPTYQTVWLYIHIGFGKIFMGALVVAAVLSFTMILRYFLPSADWLRRFPNDASLSELSYRFILFGLIFDTLMLIGGAVWAQKAWGRYWFWDPLETWAFITWLFMGLAVHAKITIKPEPLYFAYFTLFVFVISYLTFFGVPLINTMPHKGII